MSPRGDSSGVSPWSWASPQDGGGFLKHSQPSCFSLNSPTSAGSSRAVVFLPGVSAGMAFSCQTGIFPTQSCCCCSSPNLPRVGKVFFHPTLPSLGLWNCRAGISWHRGAHHQGSWGSDGWGEGTQPQFLGKMSLCVCGMIFHRENPIPAAPQVGMREILVVPGSSRG